MGTDKFDLHTIDYAVQGWDSILAADMEKLDDVIPSRELVTLGETVTAYQPLCFSASDGKWYKARANGTLQPAHGLALEGGDEDDVIRIHRMGTVTNAGWNWANLGDPVYLDPNTAGALTQTAPAANRQIMGYALTATSMLQVALAANQNTFDPASPGAIGETSPGSVRGNNKEIFKTCSADGPLTAAECAGTIVSNFGMTDADCLIELDAAVEGLAFLCKLPAVRARYFRLKGKTGSGDKIYLLTGGSFVAGSSEGSVGVESGYAANAACSFFTTKSTDGGYDWYAIPIAGTWGASA